MTKRFITISIMDLHIVLKAKAKYDEHDKKHKASRQILVIIHCPDRRTDKDQTWSLAWNTISAFRITWNYRNEWKDGILEGKLRKKKNLLFKCETCKILSKCSILTNILHLTHPPDIHIQMLSHLYEIIIMHLTKTNTHQKFK